MTENDVYVFLSQQRYGVLSSVGTDGAPQSAVVGFAVTPKLEIIFDTVKSSRKYPNLVSHASCSFAVWVGPQTVQYEGLARELRSPELEQYQEIYFTAFPDGPDRLSWPGIVYFAVKPNWVRFSDFGPSREICEFRF